MESKVLKVSEIFKSIQGEGRYQGAPVLFLRLSGCTRNCSFCDSLYHSEGQVMSFEGVYKEMSTFNKIAPAIVITGGEPLLQWPKLKKFLDEYFYHMKLKIHLETNGDLIKSVKLINELSEYFNYICVSPKCRSTAERVSSLLTKYKNKYGFRNTNFIDIKVVTDLDATGVDMLEYATTLMPLSTYNSARDLDTQRKVWDYCVLKNKFYSARLHVGVWGNKRAV